LDIQLLWVCSSCSRSEILKHKDTQRERQSVGFAARQHKI
jgi:hypothetical protein